MEMPNQGNVVIPHNFRQRLDKDSTKAMIEGLAHVALMPRQSANNNELGDMTLKNINQKVFNREMHLDGQKYITDAHYDIIAYHRDNNGTARQSYGSFAHVTHGLLYGLECYLQPMAAGGCAELIPLLHAVMEAKDKAADASHALNGGL